MPASPVVVTVGFGAVMLAAILGTVHDSSGRPEDGLAVGYGFCAGVATACFVAAVVMP